MDNALRSIVEKYRIRALNDVPFSPQPLADQGKEEDEEGLRARTREFSYEIVASEWRPIPCQGEPRIRPCRFIDGSLFSRSAALLAIKGRPRPAVLGCVGALALEVEGRRLVRQANSLRLETVLCLLSNGMPTEDLQILIDKLRDLDIRLVPSETAALTADIEVLRKRCWNLANQQMEDMERDVLFSRPNVPTIVDGLLERRLTTKGSQGMPVFGMVKRQMRRHLPTANIGILYELKPGERTPAFLLETEHAFIVSWYLRLSGTDDLSPSYGIVRLSAPQAYLEQNFPKSLDRSVEISAISHWIYTLRHKEGSYARADISIEPIVRVEDELHAILPNINQQVTKLHRALRL